MPLRKATAEDFKRLTDFYRYVIANMKDMATFGLWEYGKHPTDEMIEDYIRRGCMYYLEEDGVLVAALAATPYQTEDYHDVSWSLPLADDEVGVVHIFCVSPDFQGKGYGRRVMKEAVEIVRSMPKKALRFDTLEVNLPAQHMYASLGFKPLDKRSHFVEKVGRLSFYFYEIVFS